MNFEKIQDMFFILNRVTEQMSIYSNVERHPEKYVVRFSTWQDMKDINAITESFETYIEIKIDGLNDNNHKWLDSFPQILDCVKEYKETLFRIESDCFRLQSYQSFHNIQRDDMASLKRHMNLCQKLKIRTIKLHNEKKRTKDW